MKSLESCRLLSNQLAKMYTWNITDSVTHLTQWFYVETQFGKNHQWHATNSHCSKVMPHERPTLLKVTIHTIKCDLVKGFSNDY